MIKYLFTKAMKLTIRNRFITELPADEDLSNVPRPVRNAAFSFVTPRIPSNPRLIHASKEVAEMIGISEENIQSEEFTAVFSGKKVLEDTKPFAMCYAGHQFGNWAGQLGDGRAINLTEIEHQNQYYTLQLKGAGKTPYSRTADGLAVLRSSIREHLCSEAMYYLGVPTTRSLSLILTGDEVLRDMMYNGNPAYEKGAVVCRIAPSFIRFGSFEIFAARDDLKNLKLLTDFTIKNYYPEIKGTSKESYIQFFEAVAESTRQMILHWQRVGFVHGVMNTDNMSIHGITIDYGPYGWLEDFNPNWTPNTTDIQHKRYRYGNQPEIALWNLYQLGNALYPLIDEVEPLERILKSYTTSFDQEYLEMMGNKLGFEIQQPEDIEIINQLIEILQFLETDMTIFFRNLSDVSKSDSTENAFHKVENAFYKPEEIKDRILDTWLYWFTQYLNRLNKETATDETRKIKMNAVNPKYVLRNYMAQLAIEAGDIEDYSIIEELYLLLKKPYDEQPEFEKWFAKRPDWARDKVGSSMLSCSS